MKTAFLGMRMWVGLALPGAACILAIVPASLAAQVRTLADPNPPPSAESADAGARLMKSGLASQFDSLGRMPMSRIGDSVTVYLFPDGNNMGRTLHARVTRRQRFDPPVSWRAACDEVAHSGWMYTLTPAAKALFGLIIPGVHPKPEVRPVPPAARDGAWQFFHAVADTSWANYLAYRKLTSDRAIQYLHADFWGAANDARYPAVKMFGVRGPDGRPYVAMSFTMRDDYPDAVNTSRIWMLDAWGYPAGTAVGSVDIYGTIDDHGIDAVVTSSGLIRWDGTQWGFPPVYSEEPCLFHKTMPLPPGAHP